VVVAGQDGELAFSSLRVGSHDALHRLAHAARPIPEKHARQVERALKVEPPVNGVRAAATKKLRGLGNSVGYLVLTNDGLAFVTRRWFVNRVHRIPFAEMEASRWKRGLLLNRFAVETSKGDREFYVFKDVDLEKASAAGRPQEPAKLQA
jgi:hypothetical protein